jgi:hypothetical protein
MRPDGYFNKDDEGEDNENYNNSEEQGCFLLERPIDELPTFQSSIYRFYSPIDIQIEQINDDITYRKYYGKCQHCSEEHYLGMLVTRCDEPHKLFCRVSRI